MLGPDDISAVLLTLQLALLSTLILLALGAPLAWWLSQTQWRFKYLIEAVIALPLVLPPTVLGFYLLIAFSPQSSFSRLLRELGIESFAFSFAGLVVGSVIYSLPFMVQPVQNAFMSIGRAPFEVAATLGSNKFQSFFRVALPLAKRGLISGAVLSFAHTLGEFGVVLMIGGNIPGETQVASIAIYEHVETLNYGAAHGLSLLLLLLSFVLLSIVYAANRQPKEAR